MDRETARNELVRLLSWLRAERGDPVVDNALYPRRRWSDPQVRRDLWRRASAAAGETSLAWWEVRMWGHLHGLTGGFRWSRAEVRRRLGVGRAAAEAGVQRVTHVVADSLVAHPPRRQRAQRQAMTRGDWEDAAAVTLGRSIVEHHPHREEIAYALYDHGQVPHSVPHTHRRVPAGTRPRKRNLKTTRYAPTARTALRRAAIEARHRSDVRGNRGAGAVFPLWATYPLWERVEGRTSGLTETLTELRGLGLSGDRDRTAALLAEGHHHMVRGDVDQETVNSFLLLEATILGQHANIGSAAVLEILELSLDVGDPRRVHAAQAREHILERHHYWRAAQIWSQRVWDRLRDPRIRWASTDEHHVAVARALERRASLAAKVASVVPARRMPDLPALARRVDRAADQVRDPDRAREWRVIAQRRALQARWGTKNRDRLLGLPARWDDDELTVLEEIDVTAARLGDSATSMSWNNQKLGVLLNADRPQEFLRAARGFVPALASEGGTRPAQVQAARSTVELARRRRSHGWRAVRDDLGELAVRLPEDTDETLRNPYAIPWELVVNGIAIG
ncbi:hypothetical protein J4H86_26120 [Spiractinospora alimapuensis]|uniref:hypothetical protein n=1 Tax=Spiractinospora alimapuensis TaxID=2820884 RepID=UPI001F44C2FB|nr:hypothetical protein [Spiractinospora alimapuensis]QVQ52137.1 hypothetical protein J4H86_26120 [Spiractinospora alimapuensis]